MILCSVLGGFKKKSPLIDYSCLLFAFSLSFLNLLFYGFACFIILSSCYLSCACILQYLSCITFFQHHLKQKILVLMSICQSVLNLIIMTMLITIQFVYGLFMYEARCIVRRSNQRDASCDAFASVSSWTKLWFLGCFFFWICCCTLGLFSLPLLSNLIPFWW